MNMCNTCVRTYVVSVAVAANEYSNSGTALPIRNGDLHVYLFNKKLTENGFDLIRLQARAFDLRSWAACGVPCKASKVKVSVGSPPQTSVPFVSGSSTLPASALSTDTNSKLEILTP
jgi:hypothetical protein